MSTPPADSFTRYQLRRTLAPWKFQESIDEAVAFCRSNRVDEIIWKIDTEEISHGLPTIEMIRSYLPALATSKKQLQDAGIVMSINPWVTQGMRDAGWDLRATFPNFEWITDITGISAKSQACPMSPAWREWFLEAYALYASTGPKTLWLEDDFRVHRHRPVTVACFCQRHVRGFAEKVGKPFTRESLAEEILRPGEPSPIRKLWFEFVGGVMCEVAELLAQRIYGEFPEVQLGLMCSDPRTHAAEKRDWDRMMKALRGPHKDVVIRPSMANYFETSPRGLYASRDCVGSTLKCVRQPVHACSELENYPYTEFSKSLRFTRGQVLLSTAMQSPSVTMNLFDHVGTPLPENPRFGTLLKESRPLVDALAETFTPGGVERGVQILSPENGAEMVHLSPGQAFYDLIQPPEYWSEALQALGTAVTWGESAVVAVSGQRIRPYEKSLETLFSKGMLLDLTAIEALTQMVGAARMRELTGVTLNSTFNRAQRPTSIEAMTDPAFGGPMDADDPGNAGKKSAPARHVTIDHVGLTTRVGDFTAAPNTRVISWQINADLQRLLPAFTLCENSLGGRVAVCPYDLTAVSYPWFLNWNRKRQLDLVVSWLFRGKTPLRVDAGAYALPIRTDYAGYTAVAVANASLDTWEKLTLRLSFEKRPTRVQRLTAAGGWVEIATHRWEENTLIVESESAVECADLAAFRIS